jgi:NitT/TauT family transport system ATP-binding protein
MTALMPTQPPTATPLSASPAISVRGVAKHFGHGKGAVLALDGVSFDVAEGEFLCLLGASGCGKSTLLGLLAGLDQPSAGTIAVPAGRTSLMFQDGALFPWLTVEENVAFPLHMDGVGRRERRRRVEELLTMVRLPHVAKKRPHELSGGMRQRVALARALAQHARVLLMDEPFAALDAMTRDLLHGELERIWRELGLSIVFVTHNVGEAVRLGDRVLLLAGGPGRPVAEFAIDLPRPRDAASTEVAALTHEITGALREEMGLHAAD